MSWQKASIQGYDNPIVYGNTYQSDVQRKFKAALVKIAQSKSLEEFTKWAKENIVVNPDSIEEAYNEHNKTNQ